MGNWFSTVSISLILSSRRRRDLIIERRIKNKIKISETQQLRKNEI
jgi:hypothetical protein